MAGMFVQEWKMAIEKTLLGKKVIIKICLDGVSD